MPFKARARKSGLKAVGLLGVFGTVGFFFFVCPSEGGLGSSWLKHALKQRSPTTLIGVVRVVVVLVLERVFVVGGEVVAATTRVLAGRGRDLDQISVAINQETGPAEMRCQPEGAVEPLGEHAFGFRRLVSEE